MPHGAVWPSLLPHPRLQLFKVNDMLNGSPLSSPTQGNVDPMVLFGPEEAIKAEVERCLRAAGPRGHILNVGHGVVQVCITCVLKGGGGRGRAAGAHPQRGPRSDAGG